MPFSMTSSKDCCDIIPERAKAAAEKYKVPNWYPHIDKMLAGAKFDMMITLTDMQEHGRLNRQALTTGHHVWSEKPMANTYKEILTDEENTVLIHFRIR